MGEIIIDQLKSTDSIIIHQLADWYFDEWAVPKETIIARLTTQNPDDILFHLIARKDGQLVATGGIHFNVGLVRAHEEFKPYSPWVSMVYCDKRFRNQGIGEFVLKAIEGKALELGYSKLYLYTNSAERLYLRNQWTTFARVLYKGKDTAVMEKEFSI
jgi:GNAT superfamily N-acetyltransferase